MSNIRAYAFASGHIGFTDSALPNGALLLAYGPEDVVRSTVEGNARRAYDNETLLVPGCPETETQTAALEAFAKFFERVQLKLGKHGIKQTLPQKQRAAR
jgi:hypothetical protein